MAAGAEQAAPFIPTITSWALSAFVQRLRYVAVNENLNQGGGAFPAMPMPSSRKAAVIVKTKPICCGPCCGRKDSTPGWSPSTRRIGCASAPKGLRLACSTTRFSPLRLPKVYATLIPPIPILRWARFLFRCKTVRHCLLVNTPVGDTAVVERSVHLTLAADGKVGGRVLESFQGQAAAAYRARLADNPELGQRLQVRDESSRDGLHLCYEFKAALHTAGPELLLITPFLLADFAAPVSFHGTVEIALSPELLVDEMPDNASSAAVNSSWSVET